MLNKLISVIKKYIQREVKKSNPYTYNLKCKQI